MFVVLCEDQKLVYESFFTFALMWALGGAVADAWKLRNSELFRHRDMSDMPRNAVTCTEDKIVNHRRAFSSFLRRWTSSIEKHTHTHTFFLCLRYHLTFWAILYLLNFWKVLYTFSQYFRWFSSLSSLSSLFIWNGRSMARGVKLPEVGECFDYQFEVASKAADRGSCEVGPNASVTKLTKLKSTAGMGSLGENGEVTWPGENWKLRWDKFGPTEENTWHRSMRDGELTTKSYSISNVNVVWKVLCGA